MYGVRINPRIRLELELQSAGLISLAFNAWFPGLDDGRTDYVNYLVRKQDESKTVSQSFYDDSWWSRRAHQSGKCKDIEATVSFGLDVE